MYLLPEYNSVYRCDIICISESFLDSTISDDDNIFHMEGYDLLRADHLDNIKSRRSLLILKKEFSFKEN